MNFTTNYGLYENPKLQSDLEIDGFLRVLDEIQGLTHVGWVASVEPVFRLDSDVSQASIEQDILAELTSGSFDSAGLRAYVLDSSWQTDDSVEDTDICMVVKVENWWDSCLPNRLSERAEIETYITEREDSMTQKLTKDVSPLSVVRSEHADIPVEGGSQLSEGYGQYQFLAVR